MLQYKLQEPILLLGKVSFVHMMIMMFAFVYMMIHNLIPKLMFREMISLFLIEKLRSEAAGGFCTLHGELTLFFNLPSPVQEKFAGVDIRVRVSGGGHVAQIYAIRQSISKALVSFYQKCKYLISLMMHLPPPVFQIDGVENSIRRGHDYKNADQRYEQRFTNRFARISMVKSG